MMLKLVLQQNLLWGKLVISHHLDSQVTLKCLYEAKNSDFIFLNKIEVCHLNNHTPKNEINVVGTFRDIEVQSCPFGMV